MSRVSLIQPTGAAPRSRLSLLLISTLFGALLLMTFALPVAADAPRQEGAETPQAAPTATVVPVVVVPARPAPAGQDLLGLTVITLGFAIGAVVAALLYSYNIQIKYYDTATKLGVSGVSVKTSSGSDFAQVRPGAQQDITAQAQVVPVITGPASVAVGVQSDEFTVTAADQPLANATWRVEPANAAIAIPPTGAAVKVIAAMPGVFKLFAKGEVDGKPTAEAALDVVAVAEQRDPVELPFVGRAYGSVVLGIILTAAVILLALAGLLSEAVVVALLTTLLGYTFGVAVASRTEG